MLVGAGDVHVAAICATETRRRHPPWMLGAEALRHFIESEIACCGEGQEADLSIEHGEVEVRTFTLARAAVQHRNDAQGNPQTRTHVRDRDAGLDWATVFFAGQAHDAAHRLENGVIAFFLRVRAGLAEASTGHIDQPRVDGLQARPIEAVALERTDREILQHYICAADQFAHHLLAFSTAKVDRD
ncbi:hypothetical protein D3C81_1427420 [compost metagenome]